MRMANLVAEQGLVSPPNAALIQGAIMAYKTNDLISNLSKLYDPSQSLQDKLKTLAGLVPNAAFSNNPLARDMLKTAISPITNKPIGLVPRLLDTCRRRQANRIILENANRGKDTADELRRQMHSHEFDVELIDPSGSKLSRMHSVSPLFSACLVYSPANLQRVLDKDGRETVDVREFAWVAEIASQCLRTPRGKQDLADCVSMGLQWLRNAGMLELQHEFIKSELERRAWKPKPLNVGQLYGVA